MAKKGPAKESSIIEVIQKMVREGEPESKIIQTLKDLGVDAGQAKRLLLLGQANTFALLEGEIRKIVAADLDARKKEIDKTIEQQAAEKFKETKQRMAQELEKKLGEKNASFQAGIRREQSTFMSKATKKISELGRVIENLSGNQVETQKQLDLMQADFNEMKIKGISSSHRFVSATMIGLGLAFCIVVLYLFVTRFGGTVSVDSVIITVAMALIGVTLMFVATLI